MNLSSIGSWKQASTSSDSSEEVFVPKQLTRQESYFDTTEVNALADGMLGMAIVRNGAPPPLPPRRVVKSSTAINYDSPTPVPPRKYVNTFEQNAQELATYIEVLKTATRHTFRGVLPKLSNNGRNVLHYVALVPDFSEYSTLITKHCSRKGFNQLILEQSLEDLLTPLHVICEKVNVEMLRCLLASKNKDVVESLKTSGRFIDKHNRTLLHCFGDGLIAGYEAAQASLIQEQLVTDSSKQTGFVDEKIVLLRKTNEAFKIKSLEMLGLLEKLYGSQALGDLLDTEDSEGDHLLSLAKRACRHDIVEIICAIKTRSLKTQ